MALSCLEQRGYTAQARAQREAQRWTSMRCLIKPWTSCGSADE
jgi:hypothetical protein